MIPLLVVLALANGADCGLTARNMAQPFHHERNPIARPFVSHGTPLTIGYFAATTAIDFTAVRELRKHHHSKLAKLYVAGALGLEAWAIASSARGMR